eukprot:CAMPEP_0170520688 /NCGR_PEP_ID=MMETSP0209-20121228/6018_1 /TAXON_ID=665100 ORGANISM="Litonotus pictus, Strain P1" /NCGR_SAMPLE_ID=MMETSP0209 /ASSEMBLY_ACC=CAM_ASM_000301 /LENGTH=277 /DNA_ID=CAMNT_0010807165 /DNA_START=116 /DNA_END=946 /DNA_ORIENTATION=+
MNIAQRSVQVLKKNDIPVIQGNINCEETLKSIYKQYPFEAVMHFAAFIEAGESVKDPKKYFINNVDNFSQLLKNIKANCSIKCFIFSSSAAVYGEHSSSIKEDYDKKPINPYGETKLKGEELLQKFAEDQKISAIALRYFNAAGCIEDGSLGEDHEPETHLIPKLIEFILKGKPVRVFGNDYPTRDGTCIRDYIHVNDLADGHLKALESVYNNSKKDNKSFEAFNLGSGNGFSILEVISELKKVVKEKVEIVYEGRRERDPPYLVANTDKAEKSLNW